MMTETKESNIPETLSAGTFVDRPFLDRINPLTPFSAKKFVPSENAKKLLDKYKKQYGKNLVVLPLDEKLKKEGSFLPGTLTADYRGGRFYDKDFVEELQYIVIHGLLHLIGYSHEKNDKLKTYESKLMKKIWNES